MAHLSTNDKNYFQYLSQRSYIGYLYRRWYLYPRLSSVLRSNVLDFGCGIGDYLKYDNRATGVDINRHNIDYCKSQGLNAELLQDSQIHFANAFFTSVIMDNVIEHIPTEEVYGVIDEVVRVLRPNGTIVVGVPGIKGYHSDSDHKHFYAEGDLLELFSEYGCNHRRTMHTPFYFPGAEKYIRQYCIYVVFEKSPGL